MLDNKKKKYISAFLVLLVFGMLFVPTAVQAAGPPYTTYTYDRDGDLVNSPAAYEFGAEYSGKSLGVGDFSGATDIFVDKNMHVYIVDTGNDRLVVLDENMKVLKNMSNFWNPEKDYPPIDGIDGLKSPGSVFVTDSGEIYVADTDNNRLVVFDQEFHYVREVAAPQSALLGEDYVYKPISVVLDTVGRIYVMSRNENQRILTLSPEGEFIGYYGAQNVKRTFLDWFGTLFQTKEQKSRSMKYIPRTYNSMAIDDKNFIWLTSNSIANWDRYSYLESKDSKNAVVKRLNPSGNDVLVRNDVFAPGGDITNPPSSIVDVAVKSNGIYSLLDDSFNHIFTYDTSGRLLYAFGGVGMQDGVMTLASALTYFGDDLLVIDKEDNVIVRYKRTEYGELLEKAIMADIDRDFDASRMYWEEVLHRNQNLEIAYRALGNNYMRNGDYKTAMEYFKYAGDKDGYSTAFRYVRTDYVKGHFFLVIFVIIAVIALWLTFTGWVKKQNRIIYPTGCKHTLKSELLYAHRAIYHPFNGFWEIKREKRGSIRSATVILLLVLFTVFYKSMGTAYLFRSVDLEYVDIVQDFANVLIPLLLWCLANWGLTTLMGGEGSIKDIYIMTCYSMTPIILMNIPVTVASNFLVNEEADFLSFFVALGYVWMVILIFVGTMIIHDYHFNKNLGSIVLSIVGIGVMLFLAILFLTLGQKIFDFLKVVYEEIAFRM